ncbi:transmembrane emp24 domain-containing protein 1 [Scaptodrosophila lebanonensis]|uniref:Transmembrane emp24 domain-containing protein 1 n=1 Tax=Drosophila lebanonensis TaxID=7225 RepID=A0A6J2U8B2_DROLE|nr:transmembrane emp24 domain-containing protein 1 [Scaptodrosophila lebanonensis]
MFQIARETLLMLFLLLLLLLSSGSAEPYVTQLTVFAEAGRMECYHHPVAATEYILIEYQVIDGGHGEAHVNFNLMDPKRVLLITEQKQNRGKHNITAEETGIYKLCFDNTISSFNRKIITFHLEVAAADFERRELEQLRKEMHTDYHFDRAFTDLHNYIGKINVNLMRSRQTQDFIRANEAWDRNLAESNNRMVNNWSMVQFTSMILVGMLQVFMLRSIFHTDGRMHNFWRQF